MSPEDHVSPFYADFLNIYSMNLHLNVITVYITDSMDRHHLS